MSNDRNIEEAMEMPNAETDKTDNDSTVEQWLQIRKEEALRVDAETAEVTWWYAQVVDPYGIRQLSEEEDCVGRQYFARSQGSDIWVSFHDLPDETREKLWKHPADMGFCDDLPF